MPLTDEEKKIKRAEYYQRNKEKIKEKNKKYYERNQEKITQQQAEYKKEYWKKNKEKITQQHAEYRKNNKDKIKQQVQDYRERNKEKRKIYKQEHYQTPTGKKSFRITNWKQRGVISNDFNELYEKYLSQTNCEECNVELTYDLKRMGTTKCLDHNHETGEFRNILCHCCNVRRK